MSILVSAETCYVSARVKCTSLKNSSKQVYFIVKGTINGNQTMCGTILKYEVDGAVRDFVEDVFFNVISRQCRFQKIQGTTTTFRLSTRRERDQRFTKMKRECVRSYSADSCFTDDWREFRL